MWLEGRVVGGLETRGVRGGGERRKPVEVGEVDLSGCAVCGGIEYVCLLLCVSWEGLVIT